MGRCQGQATPPAHQALDGEAVAEPRHHHLTRPGLKTAVDHQQVAIADTSPLHRDTPNPQQHGAARVTHQQGSQIEAQGKLPTTDPRLVHLYEAADATAALQGGPQRRGAGPASVKSVQAEAPRGPLGDQTLEPDQLVTVVLTGVMGIAQAQIPQLGLQRIQHRMVAVHRRGPDTNQILSETEAFRTMPARRRRQPRQPGARVGAVATAAMGRPAPDRHSKSQPPTPSPMVIKLQIAGAVFVPPLLLGLWLQHQGFW